MSEKKSLQSISLLNNKLYVEYDEETNEVLIDNSSDIPLTINFKGQLNLQLSEDFLLETDGEFDLITNGNMICLDSVNSVIHLNSRKCKKLRTDDSNTNPTKICEEQNKLAKQGYQRHKKEMSHIEKLQSIIDNMNTRLLKLEKHEDCMIDINPIHGEHDE